MRAARGFETTRAEQVGDAEIFELCQSEYAQREPPLQWNSGAFIYARLIFTYLKAGALDETSRAKIETESSSGSYKFLSITPYFLDPQLRKSAFNGSSSLTKHTVTS